jgi:hypothetical protein
VARGIISVKGRISSRNSKTKITLLPPYIDLSAVAAIGAQITSESSPKRGTATEIVPIESISRQTKNLERFIDGDWKLCAVDDLDVFVKEEQRNPLKISNTVFELSASEKGTCSKFRGFNSLKP